MPFSSGIPATSDSFKVIYRPIIFPGTEAGSTIQSLAVDNQGLPTEHDPRIILPAGMVPASQASYRFYITVSDVVNFQQAQILSGAPFGLGGLFGTSDLSTFVIQTRMAALVFEGRDVIDLPTAGLESDGSVITVPDKIFRAYHAGDRLVQPGDDVAVNSTLAFGAATSDNVLGRVVRSDEAADDAKLPSQVLGKQFVDSASNRIELDGTADFVSYTAVDRPLFRDVIFSNVSVLAFGSGSGLTGETVLTDVAPGAATSYFVRFAFVDVSLDDEPARFAWRMSESYGVTPNADVVRTPQGLLTTPELEAASASDEGLKHYVYDLNEPGDEMTGGDFSRVPAKTAYSPTLARAKSSAGSDFFDENFRASIVDVQKGFAEGGLTTFHAANIPLAGSNIASATFSFTSPINDVDLSSNGRIGLEYSLRRVANTASSISLTSPEAGFASETIFLARTREAADGIASFYDVCVNSIVLIDVASGPAGSVLVERMFDDGLWSRSRTPTEEESELDRFLIGEFPNRSEGHLAFHPESEELQLDASGSEVAIPDDKVVTGVILQDDGPLEGTFLLGTTEDPGEDALFEAATNNDEEVPSDGQSRMVIGLPGTEFSNAKEGGGLSLKGVIGVDEDKDFLPAMEGDETSSDPSEFQLSGVKEQGFPVGGAMPTVMVDDQRGRALLAFENEGRIDMGYRRFAGDKWIMLRDVVLRIHDDFGQGDVTTDDLPQASSPLLLNDGATSSITLFYMYKKRLLARSFPLEMIISAPLPESPSSNDVLSSQGAILDEKALVKELHQMRSTVVYDETKTGDDDSEESSLDVDVRFGNVILPAASSSVPGEGENDRVAQYGACVDIRGHMFCFIQIGPVIKVRVSSNRGVSWDDVLGSDQGDLQIIRPLPDDDDDLGPEFPTCGYDVASDMILLFFFFQGKLMLTRIPALTLTQPPEDVEETFRETLRPFLLVGELDEDLQSRGITRGSIEEEVEGAESSDDEEQRLTPHRVSFVTTDNGHYRLFFKDEEKRLKSLVSINSGSLWLTEKQFTNT